MDKLTNKKASKAALFAIVMTIAFMSLSEATTVLPETATKVNVSRTDINRVYCPGSDISDVLYSEEKGIEVKITGKSAFLKFLPSFSTNSPEYEAGPAEFYIVCGNDMYTIIAEPKGIPAVTINLSSSLKERIGKTKEFFKGLAFEEGILKLIRHAYTNSLPDYFRVKIALESINIFNDLKMQLVKTVQAEGAGLLLKEYAVQNISPGEMEIKESDFLNKEITTRAVAVAVDPHILKENEIARLFVVEKANDDNQELFRISKRQTTDGS
jgi:conjugal transfer pilus assembly protein TraK